MEEEDIWSKVISMFEVCENGCCFENLTLSSSLEMEGEALGDTMNWLRKHLKDDPKGFIKLLPYLRPLSLHFRKRKVLYPYLSGDSFIAENDVCWDELDALLDADVSSIPVHLLKFATLFDAYLRHEEALYPVLERFDEDTCKKIVSDWIFIGFCYIGCNPEAQSFVYFNEK